MRYVARVVEYHPANVGDTTVRCRLGYWAWARVSGRETSSLSIDRLQQQVLLLRRPKLTSNCFLASKFLDCESDFRKLGSVAMLRSLIRILRASLVQIDTEMAEKYAKQQQPAMCGKFAFGR